MTQPADRQDKAQAGLIGCFLTSSRLRPAAAWHVIPDAAWAKGARNRRILLGLECDA